VSHRLRIPPSSRTNPKEGRQTISFAHKWWPSARTSSPLQNLILAQAHNNKFGFFLYKEIAKVDLDRMRHTRQPTQAPLFSCHCSSFRHARFSRPYTFLSDPGSDDFWAADQPPSRFNSPTREGYAVLALTALPRQTNSAALPRHTESPCCAEIRAGQKGFLPLCFAILASQIGQVRRNFEPSFGIDSIQIYPPLRPTMLLQIARPRPAPEISGP